MDPTTCTCIMLFMAMYPLVFLRCWLYDWKPVYQMMLCYFYPIILGSIIVRLFLVEEVVRSYRYTGGNMVLCFIIIVMILMGLIKIEPMKLMIICNQ